ncbi:MYND-type domain-containing protein [Favolaschia claudopus]|uniref:MYND-type domain-containing protein n=1 Tax=Favolaschia claudopus TaxID=2862362 RepID=A0AAW0APK1_9AGAR
MKHRSLRLSNLDLLPISIRRFATPAAKGCFRNLQRLVSLIIELEDHGKYTLCLPVFYAVLDPSKLPTEPSMNCEGILCAYEALMALRSLQAVDSPAFEDFWPRIWFWIVFFHCHPECITDECQVRIPMSLQLLDFIRLLTPDNADSRIDDIVGVRSMIMEAWTLIIQFKPLPDHPYFVTLCEILRRVEFNRVSDFDEILDGTGGVDELANLLIQSILCFTNNRALATEDWHFLNTILGFLQSLGHKHILLPALLRNDGPSVITSLGVASIDLNPQITQENLGDQLQLVRLCLDVLCGMLSKSHNAMRSSLAAGLLTCTVYGSFFATIKVEARQLVTELLPAYTVHHSVLVELQQQMAKGDVLQSHLDLYDDWVAFQALARNRIAFMNEIAQQTVSLKVCCNPECAVILDKYKFKRCSRCKRAYYCSVACHKTDWTIFDHRSICRLNLLSDIRAFPNTTFRFDRVEHLLGNQDISKQDLSFMRKLLHRDSTLHADDDTSPFVTVFDYRTGYLTIWLSDVHTMREEDDQNQVNWDEYVSRATHSAGRMDLHLILIQPCAPGEGTRRIMFPQWSDAPGFHHNLLLVMREEHMEDFVWDDAVRRAISECESRVWVHP